MLCGWGSFAFSLDQVLEEEFSEAKCSGHTSAPQCEVVEHVAEHQETQHAGQPLVLLVSVDHSSQFFHLISMSRQR